MTGDPTRNFDAPRTGSIAAALVLARNHWTTVIALVVNVSILQAMAFGLAGVDRIGSDRVDASIASVSILVAAEPDASTAEVDALGPLVRAVPGVATATLRSKDDALKSLIANGLPPPDGRNPLPDVWVVRLQAGAVGNGRSLSTAWNEKRQALASLPRVASASTDERWIATIDRGMARWRGEWPTALSIGLGILALAMACTAYLAGRGLSVPSSHKADAKLAGMRALALLAVAVGLVSGLMGYAVSWAVTGVWLDGVLGGRPSPFGRLIGERPLFSGSMVLATMLIVAVSGAIGCRSHE